MGSSMQTTRPNLSHHFLTGHEWRADELGETKLQGKYWRRWSWWQSVLLGVAILGLISMAHRPHWKPYYIEIDTSSGAVRVIGPAPDRYIPPQAVAKASVRELVETLRGISTDKDMQRERWKHLRVGLTAAGKQRLVEWDAQRQPLRQTSPVKVEILRAIPKPGSGTTWDVRWA